MAGLKLTSDQNFANGGALLRSLTATDRAHLVAEWEAGRDIYTTRANSAPPIAPATSAVPISLYGNPVIDPAYGVELVAPKVGDASGARWIDSNVPSDLGTNYTIAFIYKPRIIPADEHVVTTNRGSQNDASGFNISDTGNGATGSTQVSMGATLTSSGANSGRLMAGPALTTPTAWRMMIFRMSGLVDFTAKLSAYRAGAIVSAVASATFTGYTRTPGSSSLAHGSYRGAAPTYNNAVDRSQDFLAGFVWANQTVILTDAECLAFYQEQVARYAALGVTI